MKQLKLTTVALATFVCLNFVFAEKPEKETTENLSTILVDKLGKDVQLTNIQEVILKEYIKGYIIQMEKSDSKTNFNDKISSKELTSRIYEAFIDSILTPDQKTQREIKISLRKDKYKK